MTKVKIGQPTQPRRYASRIWHWRKKCYLYASDYNIKGFPVGR